MKTIKNDQNVEIESPPGPDPSVSYRADGVRERRRFLNRTLSLTAVLAAVGISDTVIQSAFNTAEAAAPADRTLAKALATAVKRKDVKPALRQFGKQLSPKQVKALSGLTKKDLIALDRIQKKMAAASGEQNCCDVGTGIF